VQHRYDLGVEYLFEEQLNVIYSRSLWGGQGAVLLTLGTQNGYQKLREWRYALQWQKAMFGTHRSHYSLRFRQEARDFTDFMDWAHRFRLRNHWRYRLRTGSPWFGVVSSEFNIYLNKGGWGEAGFASHRSLLGIQRRSAKASWTILYLHDYRKIFDFEDHRHVIQVQFSLNQK
jgi:hypothetical protein